MSVVTGASGHVGANLLRALLERGEGVRALVHVDASALSGLGVELARGDVCDLESLRAAFDGADVVYHLAGHISVAGGSAPRLADVNVSGTRNVLRACLDCHVRRLVHFSSIHAIAATPAGVAADESTALVDASSPSYDASKAEGERIVMRAVAAGFDAVVIAPTAIVGPHDYRPSYFGRVLLRLFTGRLPVVVCGGFDWVDVRDVVAAAIAAAATAATGSKYLVSGHWLSLTEVANLASAIAGAARPLGAAPLALARACGPLGEAVCRLTGREPLFTRYSVEALSQHRLVSHEKATRDLGYTPRPFERSLVDTYDWFRDHGYLSGAGRSITP